MSSLVAIPVMLFAMMLQIGIISRINLLSGNADLILTILAVWSIQEKVKSSWFWGLTAGILVAFVSGLPWFIPISGYLLVVGIGRLIHRRVWQAPILATFVVVFFGTILMQLMTIAYLLVSGGNFQLNDAISLIVLPSTLLNFLTATPIYFLFRSLTNWLHPSEVNE